MKNLGRPNLILALLAGVTIGISCSSDNSPKVHNEDASAKSDAGQTGGNGSGGTSAKGGTAGNAAGGNSAVGGSAGSNAGAGGNTGSGGNAGAGGGAGSGGSTGSGGRSGGASGSATGGAGAGGGGTAVGGAATGGTAKGGAGGSAGAGGNVAGNSGTGRDAGPDLATTDGPSAERPGTDTIKKDVSGADSACPSQQTLCDGTCVDTSTSSTNCGGCGTTCASDQVCSGGSCVGTTANDGCTNTLASNLTVQQIAVYQTVKIPVMDNGTEVAAASRNAAVVQGRQTLVRVFVTPGSSWTARELAARLTLVPSGGQPAVYSSKKTISAASTDADTKTTFGFDLPAASMVAPLNYSLEIVECGTDTGTAGQARFPATGTIDMGVKNTGVLKVKLIPLQVGTLLPDTSDTTMAPYAAEMKAMYPITDISFSVGDTLTVTDVEDWSGTLDQVRAKRSADKPANDVYYYGLIKPADTLRAYCQSSCITGIGFVVDTATGSFAGSARVAMGIGFADKASTETMAHEIGHNHGRNHAPCSTAGTITGIDANYPSAYTNAIIGVWGYDSRTQTLLDPSKWKDIMSYCNNQWISDYNYKALVTRVAAVNGVANVLTVNAEMGKWRVILLDDRGPRWGIPLAEPGPAEGQPELATIYDGTGEVLTSVRVYRTQIGDISAAMYMVPEPQDNWYAIAVHGAAPLPFAAAMPKL
jgi:hypothetical protein